MTEWTDGECAECGRETSVVHVDGHGPLGIVCLDRLSEPTEDSQ